MRRLFLHIVLFVSGVLCAAAKERKVLLLHTSDTHSCVEPVAENYSDTAMAGKGGYARRAALVQRYRAAYGDAVLLLDCGDFSQGSVYYNLFCGDVEVRLMNEMRYDACAIGNHEFDFGMDNLARLIHMADFPFVCCNYDFVGTPLEGLVKPYIIKDVAGMRVGIFGLSPDTEGLVSHENCKGIGYVSPVKAAQKVMDTLRGEEHCDLVVCLSHLGWDIDGGCDQALISSTTGMDILLGGHSHTYFDHPQYVRDKAGHEVMVEHTGKNARFVGIMEVTIGQ